MLNTTSMLEDRMKPPVLTIISTLQATFPAYHYTEGALVFVIWDFIFRALNGLQTNVQIDNKQ